MRLLLAEVITKRQRTSNEFPFIEINLFQCVVDFWQNWNDLIDIDDIACQEKIKIAVACLFNPLEIVRTTVISFLNNTTSVASRISFGAQNTLLPSSGTRQTKQSPSKKTSA